MREYTPLIDQSENEPRGQMFKGVYIGLKDMHGNPIHEGAELMIHGGVNDGRTCTVVYDPEKASFVGIGNFLFQYLERFNGVYFDIKTEPPPPRETIGD